MRQPTSPKRHRSRPLACLLKCFTNCCCLLGCCLKKSKRKKKTTATAAHASTNTCSVVMLNAYGSAEFSTRPDSGIENELEKSISLGEAETVCRHCSARFSQTSTKSPEGEMVESPLDDDVFQEKLPSNRNHRPMRSLSAPITSFVTGPLVNNASCSTNGCPPTSSPTTKLTKKSAGDVPHEMERHEGGASTSRLSAIAQFFVGKSTSPTTNLPPPESEISASDSVRPISRSPSNYCRVARCEDLHLHEITPKCLETFAPSSTCSSCQNCKKQHIGPNHDQVLLVSQLLKPIQTPIPYTPTERAGSNASSTRSPKRTYTSSLLLQWPLPEYRPQESPVKLYKCTGI